MNQWCKTKEGGSNMRAQIIILTLIIVCAMIIGCTTQTTQDQAKNQTQEVDILAGNASEDLYNTDLNQIPNLEIVYKDFEQWKLQND